MRFPFLPFGTSVILLSFTGCANHEALHRGSIRKAAVSEVVEMQDMATGRSNTSDSVVMAAGIQGGAIGAGVAALLVGLSDRGGADSQLAGGMAQYDYDLREGLRQEFKSTLNQRKFFPEPVQIVPPEASLPGEEILIQRQLPQFYLKIVSYGFGKAPFASTLRPFAVVEAKLRRGNVELWSGEAEATSKDQLPTGTAKEFAANPQLLRSAWAAAARVIANRLADRFAEDYR